MSWANYSTSKVGCCEKGCKIVKNDGVACVGADGIDWESLCCKRALRAGFVIHQCDSCELGPCDVAL